MRQLRRNQGTLPEAARPTQAAAPLAWGRDYSDVAPLKGVVFTEGGHRLSVTVTVTRT